MPLKNSNRPDATSVSVALKTGSLTHFSLPLCQQGGTLKGTVRPAGLGGTEACVAGFSLLETLLSVGLLSVVIIGAMAAFGGVAKVSTTSPQRDAAEWEMRRIITLESAAAKYTDPTTVSINPVPWNTSMPSPVGTPIPITVSASRTTAGGAPAMSLTITYPQAGSTATLTKSIPIVRKAPAPQTTVAAPGTYADPNSTPAP